MIRVRNVEPTAVVAAKRVLDRLETGGVPNYVGEQRFGYRMDNAPLGRRLLLGRWKEMLDLMLGQPRAEDFAATREGREAYEKGDYVTATQIWPRHQRHERQALEALRQGKSPEKAVMAIDGQQRDFLISALQSEIFNRVLHRRISDGLIDRLTNGDLAWKHDSRAVFQVDQAVADQENAGDGRVGRLEVSPSGPMWGTEMLKASGKPGEWEREALESFELSETDLHGGRQGTAEGARRPMRTPIRDTDISAGVDEHGPYIRLAFDLPRGCFATTVLREIMKTPPQATEDIEEEA